MEAAVGTAVDNCGIATLSRRSRIECLRSMR